MNPYLWQRRYQPHQTLNKPGRTIEDCTITYQHLRWVTNGTLPASPPAASVFVSHKNMDRDTGCPTPPSPKNSWFLGYKFATVFGYSSNINCISSQIEFVTQYCRWQVSLKLSVPVSRFRELVMQGQSTLYNTAQQWVIQHSGPSYIPVDTIDHTGGVWAAAKSATYLTLAADDGDQFDLGRGGKVGFLFLFNVFCCSLRKGTLGNGARSVCEFFNQLICQSPNWIMIVTFKIHTLLPSLKTLTSSAVLRELIGCRSQNTYIY